MLVARPPQGALRDWDSFAVPGIAIALAAAWALARAIDAGRAPGLAAPLAIVTALGALQWLAHFADAPRGRARLEQLMIGPPPREAVDRARTWDFLGWRWFRDENYEASAAAFEHAVEAAPSPRNLTHWAMAETMRGRPERALSIYQQAVERDSNLTLGWFGVGVSAINSGDRAAAETAARALTRLAPTNPKTLEIIEWLERTRATSPAPQRQ
jgi:tetratricopeptide (TPR) repeat protein